MEAKSRKHFLVKEIICRNNLPIEKLCFIYYKDWCNRREFTNVCLGWIEEWKIRDGIAYPIFRNLTKDGKPGNYNHLDVIQFEICNEPLVRARQILKDAKKGITQEKKKLLNKD